MRVVQSKAKGQSKRIVFPDGDEERVLRAAEALREEELCEPVLLGPRELIETRARELGVDLAGVEIVDPLRFSGAAHYARELARLRGRKGVTERDAQRLLRRRAYFGVMMVRMGDAQGLVGGLTMSYPESIRPALQVIGLAEGRTRAAGVYLVIQEQRVLFFADGSVNPEPGAEELAEIAKLGADTAEWFGFQPVVAFLSYANFGSVRRGSPTRVARAVELARQRWPGLPVEGEMQADLALDPSRRGRFPFAEIGGAANVLVFPSLDAAHIAVRLMDAIGGATVVGPILMGMRSPVNSLQATASIADIVNLTAITVLQAQKEY
jgi:malate dehydrogenase (oxaloacetate-decarboxylating)(NADP+)